VCVLGPVVSLSKPVKFAEPIKILLRRQTFVLAYINLRVHIGATWRIQLNVLSAAAMWLLSDYFDPVVLFTFINFTAKAGAK